jgi:hypothetical protein
MCWIESTPVEEALVPAFWSEDRGFFDALYIECW